MTYFPNFIMIHPVATQPGRELVVYTPPAKKGRGGRRTPAGSLTVVELKAAIKAMGGTKYSRLNKVGLERMHGELLAATHATKH